MKRIQWTIAVFIFMTGLIALQSQNPVLSPSAPVPQELIVDVDLINITATVMDESGRYAGDLTAEDFRVVEDGKEQKISFFSHDSRGAISLGVLMDTSGSLQDKLHQGLQTMRTVAATLSSDDEMFVMTFDSNVNLRQRFTNDPEEMQRSLRDMHAHGETALYDALAAGLHEMQTAKHQKQILLLVTDGFDTRSRITADQAEDLLRSSHVLLYAIGIDDGGTDRPVRRRPRYRIYDYMLNKLCRAGGGRLVRLYTGESYDLRSLSDLFLGELHGQYTLGYYSSDHHEGPRNIEVHVTKPGVQAVHHVELRPAGENIRNLR